MKKIVALLLALAAVLTLCACRKKCDHQWVDASCKAPKTCAKCGATEGEKASHLMKNATCTEPKTCSVCGETEGEMPTGHKWVEATCTMQKHCTACGATEGEAPGHKWVDNGKGSKTCSVCGENDGSGTVSMSYTKYVSVDLSKNRVSLNLTNPDDSTQNMVVQVVLEDKVLAQSEELAPGKGVSRLELSESAKKDLKAGRFEGKLQMAFYDRESHKEALLHTEITVTIEVVN